jgi:peptide/nickel transport system permease protein
MLGISAITFLLVRLLPGNPAYVIAGPAASPTSIKAIEKQLGLDQPIPLQYLIYLKNVLHGDLGTSWYTSSPVSSDLLQRFPATLELITCALILSLIIGIPLGILSALGRNRGVLDKGTFVYGLFAGALPDFWLGLILIFFLYFKLHWFPAPVGQIDGSITLTRVTGMDAVDSLLTANWTAFNSSILHLVLPVLTLTFVYMAPIVKMARSTMEDALTSDYVTHATASGLSPRVVMWYALKNSLPPVVTIIGVIYGFLLGGAVLVETVFSWGGLGQYAVQSIENADFSAIQGFVLVAATFTLFVYMLVDIAYFIVDPRIRV